MSTPIINAQMDAINGSMATLKGDLATLRPLIKSLKENALNAYATESLSNQAVASFTDGANNVPVKSLSVAITPTQNLNGQPSPYPAGGGKNKLHLSTNPTTVSGVTFTETANGITIQNAPSSSTFVTLFSGTLPVGTYTISDASGGSGSTHQLVLRNSGGAQGYVKDSAYTFSVTDANEGYEVRLYVYSGNTTSLVKPQMESGSTATAYAPFSNICPISGHTEVNVVRTGVNVWDEETEVISTNLFSKNFIKVQPSTDYYISTAGYNIQVTWYDEFKNAISNITKRDTTITSPNNAHYMKFFVASSYGTTYNHNISINYPSTDHDYHAYAGQTYTIDLDGTRYGGTLNVTTGVLTIDRAMKDLGSLSWTYYTGATNPIFYADIADGKNGGIGVASALIISSQYRLASNECMSAPSFSTFGDFIFAQNSVASACRVIIRDSRYTDAPTFTTAMSGVQLVYELATPITVQLSATEVTTLLGQNNIWADTGDITEVTIRCDTALYIQKLVG